MKLNFYTCCILIACFGGWVTSNEDLALVFTFLGLVYYFNKFTRLPVSNIFEEERVNIKKELHDPLLTMYETLNIEYKEQRVEANNNLYKITMGINDTVVVVLNKLTFNLINPVKKIFLLSDTLFFLTKKLWEKKRRKKTKKQLFLF